MRNREQRREYERKIKKDKRVSTCPLCHRPALFYTATQIKADIPEDKKELQKEDFDVILVCENCGQIVHDEPEVGKLLQPGLYLPIKLDIFEYALRHPPTEEKTDDGVIEAEFTESND